jgi:hypothetical protein
MQTVMVTKRSVINPKNGKADIVASSTKIYSVRAVYSDGRVLATSGDTWRVKSCSSQNADFIAIY